MDSRSESKCSRRLTRTVSLIRPVTDTELSRIVWTLGLGVGTVVMLGLLAQALIDVYAISISQYAGIHSFRMSVQSDVWDQALLTAAVAGFFLSGVISYFGHPPLTIGVIVLSAYLLVVLGFVKLFRRHRVFGAIRLRRKTNGGKA